MPGSVDLRLSLGSRNGYLVNMTSRYFTFGVLIYIKVYALIMAFSYYLIAHKQDGYMPELVESLQWEWLSGQCDFSLLHFWHPNEPSDTWANCVILGYRFVRLNDGSFDASWGWNDEWCGSNGRFICEFE